MSDRPIRSMDGMPESVELTFSSFASLSGESPRASTERSRRELRAEPARRPLRAFERLLGTLSLADLNEYREAAGREPDLDAKALKALNESADRFFPPRGDENGGRFLRNAYLKYMSEKIDLSGGSSRRDRTSGNFEQNASAVV